MKETVPPKNVGELTNCYHSRFIISKAKTKTNACNYYLCMSLCPSRHSKSAADIRDAFKTYFNSDEGGVYW